MPGSHDLSVENLRLHERIVESEKQTKHVVKTTTSAPTAKHSVRPPPKPDTVARSQNHSKSGSKAGSKRGGSTKESINKKEILVVTVIEEEDEDDDLPPKAPSVTDTASKYSDKKPLSSAKAPPSHASHHSHRSNHKSWDIYHIPEGIPLPPGFSKFPEVAEMPLAQTHSFKVQENDQTALIKLPSSQPVKSVASGVAEKMVAKRFPASSHVSHHSKSSSHHSKTSNKSKATKSGSQDAELRDVIFEEVREVTRRRYVVKMPGHKIREWRYE